jgi:hypothetical protein
LVIGAQRAESTYVQFCLSNHPEIWMPHGETQHFDDPNYQQAEPDFLKR